MSELKAIRSGEIYNIIEYEDCYRTDDLYYPKSEVDAAIEELKDENRRLNRALWLARAESAKNANYRYHRLAQKEVCDPQPYGWNCYINGELYPTGKMSRKLEPHYWFDIWDNVERKCRAKAEEYYK